MELERDERVADPPPQLDARVDGWCAIAAAAARRAFRATETTFPARDEELARRDSSSVQLAKAPELASTEGMEQK